MEWTDIRITVPKARAEEAEAIATGISGGGIYIEDYSDLETQVEAIAHVDLIEQDLLDKPRDQVIVHMYLAPDEPPAEVLALLKDRLDSCEMPYTLNTEGVEQQDWDACVFHCLNGAGFLQVKMSEQSGSQPDEGHDQCGRQVHILPADLTDDGLR